MENKIERIMWRKSDNREEEQKFMFNVLSQIIVLFTMIAIGYFCKKTKLISNNMNQDVSNLLVNITVPAMIIVSLSGLSFSEKLLIETVQLLGISLFMYGFFVAISYFSMKLYQVQDTTRDIFQFALVFGNTSYMGYPVAHAVFGDQGLFYMAVCDVISPLFLWTFGVMIMCRPQKESLETGAGILSRLAMLKKVINPSIIGVCIGFLLLITAVKLPQPIEHTLQLVGGLTTPLAMIFIGSVLGDMDFRIIFQDKKAILCSVQRVIFLPLMVLAILKLFNFEGYLVSIPVLYAAMPIAALTSILASKYGNDYHLASKLIFISTLMCIITIPGVVWLLYRL